MKAAHYGYIKGTKSNKDGKLDVFVKPGIKEDHAGPVYIVNQVDPKTGAHQEWMMFAFTDVSNDAATVELAWEKLRVPFRIETDTTNQALANIKKEMSGEVKDWETPYGAASFAFNAKLDNRAEAMKWIDQSIGLQENYWNLRLKASMLEQDGKRKEAVTVAEKAVKLGKDSKDPASEIAKTEKLIAEWKAGSSK